MSKIRTPFQQVCGLLPAPVHNWIYRRWGWYRERWGIGIRL